MEFSTIQDIVSLNKAYSEGVYADTPQNRKLGRVGMSYAAYVEKTKGNKENQKRRNLTKKPLN